jgi:hypothetical protein
VLGSPHVLKSAYRPSALSSRHNISITVAYSAVSEFEGKTARVHFNRLKAVLDGREVDTSAPEQGLWPDVQRVLRGVLDKRTVRDGVEYQVRRAGRNGFVWVGAEDLPDVVVNAYEMSRGERAGIEVGQMLHRGI